MAMSNLPAAPFGRTRFMDMAPGNADFAAAVIDGLSRPQKALPGTFFHDETGSALFQRLCDQPEYYLARAEQAILERAGAPIAALLGPGVQLVELGSGSSRKVRCLLDRLVTPLSYVGIDMSRDHLRRACDRLDRPAGAVQPALAGGVKQVMIEADGDFSGAKPCSSASSMICAAPACRSA